MLSLVFSTMFQQLSGLVFCAVFPLLYGFAQRLTSQSGAGRGVAARAVAGVFAGLRWGSSKKEVESACWAWFFWELGGHFLVFLDVFLLSLFFWGVGHFGVFGSVFIELVFLGSGSFWCFWKCFCWACFFGGVCHFGVICFGSVFGSGCWWEFALSLVLVFLASLWKSHGFDDFWCFLRDMFFHVL